MLAVRSNDLEAGHVQEVGGLTRPVGGDLKVILIIIILIIILIIHFICRALFMHATAFENKKHYS